MPRWRAAKRVASKRVEVRPGEKALAPNVDHPQGFAVENETRRPLTVSFRFDLAAHVMMVVVEEPGAARRPPGEASTGGYAQPSPEQPV